MTMTPDELEELEGLTIAYKKEIMFNISKNMQYFTKDDIAWCLERALERDILRMIGKFVEIMSHPTHAKIMVLNKTTSIESIYKKNKIKWSMWLEEK